MGIGEFHDLGFGIAVAGIAIGATILEIYDKPASGLWMLVVLCILFADWK